MADATPTRRGKLVHPRLPDQLHADVTEYAAAHHRSITNAVIYLIERGLQAEGDTTRYIPHPTHTR